jgi:hypothetical protein
MEKSLFYEEKSLVGLTPDLRLSVSICKFTFFASPRSHICNLFNEKLRLNEIAIALYIIIMSFN